MSDRRTMVAACSVAALVLAVGLTACTTPDDETEAAAPAPVPVTVAAVQVGEISDMLTATGETVAATTLRLASPVAGRVTMLTLLPGDRAEAGAAVARVLPLESEATLHGLALLRNSDQGTATRGLGDIPLRAPFSAVVSARSRNPGEQVAAGEVLLELFDPASLYVVAQVPAQRSGAIVPGLRVEILAGDTALTGEVRALLPVTTPDALTMPVRIAVAGSFKPALLGAAVQCRIELAIHRDALLVPRSALVSSTVGDHGVVLVADGGNARERAVSLGLRTADHIEITDGLAQGEIVLVGGHYSLPDGTAIATQSTSK